MRKKKYDLENKAKLQVWQSAILNGPVVFYYRKLLKVWDRVQGMLDPRGCDSGMTNITLKLQDNYIPLTR